MLSLAGGRYRVLSDGEVLVASLPGRVKARAGDKVLVGDRVSLRIQDDRASTIDGVLPRRSVLQRRSPGRGRGIRSVAANVDQVIAVGSVCRPDWDGLLMDRFIVVAEANHLPVLLVANKVDLGEAADHLEPYRRVGYRTLAVSATRGDGVDALRAHLAQQVSLFAGPTGVGKSSLLNVVQPGLRLRTGDVSRRSGAGRHTTVSAEMHPLTGGGFVVDTPGLRDIGLWGVEPRDVADAFPEIGAVAGHCRFDNCRHQEEPGCAAVLGVEQGEIAASRLASYRRLLSEALAVSRPWES